MVPKSFSQCRNPWPLLSSLYLAWVAKLATNLSSPASTGNTFTWVYQALWTLIQLFVLWPGIIIIIIVVIIIIIIIAILIIAADSPS